MTRLNSPMNPVLLLALSLVIGLFPGACIRKSVSSPATLEITLYLGVENVVRLGDTDSKVLARAGTKGVMAPLKENPDLQALRFTHVISFKEIGIEAYLRSGRVALIEIQERFQGKMSGRKLALFPLSSAKGNSWEEDLIKELGTPKQLLAGGKLASEALFYSWGDIAFNGQGPNQVALYRDDEVATYRTKHFGRTLNLFPKK